MNAAARALLGVISLLLTSLVAVAPPAQSATAGYTTLCRGYATCARAGMGNDGYSVNGGSMYWRMYSGHNCTNYAAYRMVRSGMPNSRPWSGGGNAEFWGTSNASITDQTPVVGAVAWWKARASPAGSAGHVGYVEQVVSPTEIIVSMDWWGGDFTWARITRTGGSWPSGFVHFNDRRLTTTAAPVVSGAARVGSTLSTSAATFAPAGAGVAYQWRADGLNISGATGSSLVLADAQEGARISVRATATKTGYPAASSTSAATDVVERAVLTSTAAPVISGQPKVASTLTTSAATFAPAGADVTYQWRANGVRISDATDPSLVLRPAHRGKRISVKATARKDGYPTLSTFSAATPPVAADELVNSTEPVVEGSAVVDQALSAGPGAWSPAPSRLLYQWTANGRPLDGATTATLTPAPELVGKSIGLTVTARKWGYEPVTVRATPTAKVAPGVLSTTVAPRLTGSSRLGQTLSLDAGSYAPEGDVSVQWSRNGATVPGATGATYPLTAADLGSRMSASTTVTRAGYATLSTALAPTGVVKSRPAMTVSLLPGRRGSSLDIAVSAEGVQPVTGNVKVRQGGRVVGLGTLRNGVVRVALSDVPAGQRRFAIRFGGAPTVTGLTVLQTLSVP